MYIDHNCIIHYELKDIRLFMFPRFVNREAMNMDDNVFIERNVKSFGHLPKSGIAEPYGSSKPSWTSCVLGQVGDSVY